MLLIKIKPKYIIAIVVLFFISCFDNSKQQSSNEEIGKNDSIVYYDDITRTRDKPINTFNKPADEENRERQRMILMQIDSTYMAIALLDEAKTEMTALSPSTLSVAERNKKSKAIFNINLIQNELTRMLDASILTNLQVRTNELAGISAELENNIAHLQSVTVKLNKATDCIGRLTNIMTTCLSKGWIKPPTPKGVDVNTLKARVL